MATATRTFRIFVSSTFSDLAEERNALQARVFPQLRQLCLEHGARFQAIDLRWGVRQEAALDQRTMQICLDEIERSRRASPRPNFIVLLGDRYGWRPPPSEMPADAFEEILASTTGAERALLQEWYRRDDNAVPPRFWLRARVADADPDAEAASWARTEAALRRLVGRRASTSATEQEIESGVLRVPDASDHVFCFFRRIEGLPEEAADYRDVTSDGQIDREAFDRLDDLKGRLRRQLPDNCHEYTARWLGRGSDPPITTDHVSELCSNVLARLTAVIRAELERLEDVPELERDIQAHQVFAADRGRHFVGRAGLLSAARAYLATDSATPLAIVGASGSGKSALMARIGDEFRTMHPASQVVARFIGATPASADIRSLLESLSSQITMVYGGQSDTVPSEVNELIKDFPARLALATATRPLVLLLDALDQLSDADRGRALAWLPAALPPHVRLVVSAMAGECEDALRRRLPPAAVLTVEPMPEAEGESLLDAWLEAVGRRLTTHQRRAVMDGFTASGGSPLYLKLALEEARRWRSSDREVAIGAGIQGVIGDLLARLSRDHGPVLTAHGLGYLASARNGLSEDEMLDVLSLDEAVFQDFIERAHHTPPEPRLPVVVWSRLFFDIEPYLTERDADGAILMAFYHRQLAEVVKSTYLSGEQGVLRHGVLSKYFAGQALVNPQTRAPNRRKLSELPYQLTNAEQWDGLYATLTDFEFLEAKCTYAATTVQGEGDARRTIYGGVYELQEDYRLALERFPRDVVKARRDSAISKRRATAAAPPSSSQAWPAPTGSRCGRARR